MARVELTLARVDLTLARVELTLARVELTPARVELTPARVELTPARGEATRARVEATWARLEVTLAGLEISELTALAFLVVLRVLIRLFFSIDMAGELLEIFYVPQTLNHSAGDWPKWQAARWTMVCTEKKGLRSAVPVGWAHGRVRNSPNG